uniref:DNA topoisomerase 6 subunit B n=1 Tax=Rhizophora mucronata TaxID=61149 RepID=A0A2P2LAL1_RHIMU
MELNLLFPISSIVISTIGSSEMDSAESREFSTSSLTVV